MVIAESDLKNLEIQAVVFASMTALAGETSSSFFCHDCQKADEDASICRNIFHFSPASLDRHLQEARTFMAAPPSGYYWNVGHHVDGTVTATDHAIDSSAY